MNEFHKVNRSNWNDYAPEYKLCNIDSAPRAQLESQIARLILGIPEIVIDEIHMSENGQ
jgi:hypothetical protein